MSRLALFGLGVALGLFLVAGLLTGIFIYFLSGGGFDVGVAGWVAVLFACAWGSFAAFRCAFKAPRRGSHRSNAAALVVGKDASTPQTAEPEESTDQKRRSAAEKLAALLRQPKDPEGE